MLQMSHHIYIRLLLSDLRFIYISFGYLQLMYMQPKVFICPSHHAFALAKLDKSYNFTWCFVKSIWKIAFVEQEYQLFFKLQNPSMPFRMAVVSSRQCIFTPWYHRNGCIEQKQLLLEISINSKGWRPLFGIILDICTVCVF